jgi:hypothetical protein
MEGSEDHLAWEAQRRRTAGAAAVAAAALTFIGAVWHGLALSDVARAGFIPSLERLQQPGPIGRLESLKVATFQAFHDNVGSLIGASVLSGLGYLAFGWALTYLGIATRARRPEFARLVLYLPAIGSVLMALAAPWPPSSAILSAIAADSAVSGFLDGSRTVDEAADLSSSGLAVFASVLGLPGALALGVALVMIALNAMRVGLLTKFMGVVGMITGVLVVLPIAGPLPVVQCFWLLLFGLLILGYWPGGTPPAWRTGEPEPWPSSAVLREQRRRAAAEARGESSDPPASPEREPVAAGRSPSASARKRKRKRR